MPSGFLKTKQHKEPKFLTSLILTHLKGWFLQYCSSLRNLRFQRRAVPCVLRRQRRAVTCVLRRRRRAVPCVLRRWRRAVPCILRWRRGPEVAAAGGSLRTEAEAAGGSQRTCNRSAANLSIGEICPYTADSPGTFSRSFSWSQDVVIAI